jgi:hypothetical protein
MALVGSIEIPISSLSGARPEATPNRGARRIVKLIETPLGWGQAIWTSPYTVDDPDMNAAHELRLCRVCVVLVGKGSPKTGRKPEPVIMTVPVTILDKYPEDSVEW